MSAQTYDLATAQGNTEAFGYSFYDANGNAIDLTTSTLTFRAWYRGWTLTKSGGAIVISAGPEGTNNVATVSLASADTAALPVGRTAKYSLKRVWSAMQQELVTGYIAADRAP